MEQFDRTTLKVLRKEINSALSAVCETHGITITLGNISFSNNEASIKMKANIEGAPTKEESMYSSYALITDLPPLHSVVKLFDGKEYKIIGWNTKARKYPIKAMEIHTGKVFKMRESQIKNALEVQKPL